MVPYTCDQCSNEYTSNLVLKEHIRNKHKEAIKQDSDRFSCNQCEFTAKYKPHLKAHKQIQHEGVRFSCDLCNVQATTRSYIKKHKLKKHLNEVGNHGDQNFIPVRGVPRNHPSINI